LKESRFVIFILPDLVFEKYPPLHKKGDAAPKSSAEGNIKREREESKTFLAEKEIRK
jgi:hypothetical protein